MKKAITAILTTLVLIIAGPVSATPVITPAIGEVAVYAVGIFGPYFMKVYEEPSTCWYEPVRKVEWKASPGYSFEVAGCDYEANKSKYNLK